MDEIKFAVLFWTVLLVASYGLVASAVRVCRWLRDRYLWVKWFSL